MKRLFIPVAAACWCLFAAYAHADSRTFLLRNRSAAQIVEQVRGMLSADGAVTVDAATNSLIVRDSAAVLRDIEKLMAKLDAPAATWKITVSPTDPVIWNDIKTDIAWTDSGSWRLGVAPADLTRNGHAIRVTSSAEADRTELSVRAGETVVLPVGKSVRMDRVTAAGFSRFGVDVGLDLREARPELAVVVSGTSDRAWLRVTPRVAFETPKGPRSHELAAVDAAVVNGQRAIFAIRSGDARDVWGPAGAGIGVAAWVIELTMESPP